MCYFWCSSLFSIPFSILLVCHRWPYRIQYVRMSLGLSCTTLASAKPMKTCIGNVYFSASLFACFVRNEHRLLLSRNAQCLRASTTQIQHDST